MTSDLTSYMNAYKKLLDKELPGFIDRVEMPETLKQAMHYSIHAGGKRIRPILMLATVEAFGEDIDKAVPVACAVEMIHTYSLIHDDLPAMDDDDLRRGKPTNHIVFGEATAILAGDALLTQSFEIIADANLSSEQKVEIIKLLSHSAGPAGMVGGQMADLNGEKQELTLDQLEYIHHHKTGKLLVFSVLAGAIIANATHDQRKHLQGFGEHMGLAFQISDDILDVEGEQDKLGKPPGSDENNEKSTYPKLLTLKGAREKLSYHFEEALINLSSAGINHRRLQSIAKFIVERDH